MAKKIGLMVMAVMLASPYFFKDSNAAQGWYTCTVNMAGPGWGTIYVQLTSSPTFTQKWFQAPTNGGKEVLAVALTAMSSGMKVYLSADLAVGAYPTIIALYLAP